MLRINRSPENPILLPNKRVPWESEATFNPSAIQDGRQVHLVYRAISTQEKVGDSILEISSIGHAVSTDGVHFKNREQLIKPEFEWEKFGCEDPRITKFEDRYFIFYTALSTFPFSADGIKVAVAVTHDFKKIEKYPVTPFNAKAMSLFPERVNGKIAALLTIDTDRPPSKICLALFDSIEEMWSEKYWNAFYADLGSHVLHLDKNERDHIELGTPPLKTKDGWLVFYSYIYNYFSPPAIFGVQAMLLHLDDPARIIGEVKRPFLIPEEEYELYGRVPHIVFPSGAIMKGTNVFLYYGAADTTGCLVKIPFKDIVKQVRDVKKRNLIRFDGNPIIEPIKEHAWEARSTCNPAAILEDGKVHILYRAMSEDNTSVMGYAASVDGVHIAERLREPAYVPREDFEMKLAPGGNSGCEDPRLTKIGDRIYMCYTAYDGKNPPRVALTSIGLSDFLEKRWSWAKPILISPPGVDDKDAALFPRKINGKYAIFHRPGVNIWIDFVDDLEFKNGKFLGGSVLMSPRESAWDSKRIGIAGPPIETSRGWLLLYHGISRRTSHYNVRAALLDLKDPSKIIYRTHETLLEPKMPYEKEGIVSNVVFPCGAVEIKHDLFVYYGGADKVVGVATVNLDGLLETLAD